MVVDIGSGTVVPCRASGKKTKEVGQPPAADRAWHQRFDVAPHLRYERTDQGQHARAGERTAAKPTREHGGAGAGHAFRLPQGKQHEGQIKDGQQEGSGRISPEHEELAGRKRSEPKPRSGEKCTPPKNDRKHGEEHGERVSARQSHVLGEPRVQGEKPSGDGTGPRKTEILEQESEGRDAGQAGEESGNAQRNLVELQSLRLRHGAPQSVRRTRENGVEDVIVGRGVAENRATPVVFFEFDLPVGRRAHVAAKHIPDESLMLVVPQAAVQSRSSDGSAGDHSGQNDRPEPARRGLRARFDRFRLRSTRPPRAQDKKKRQHRDRSQAAPPSPHIDKLGDRKFAVAGLGHNAPRRGLKNEEKTESDRSCREKNSPPKNRVMSVAGGCRVSCRSTHA